MFYLRRPIPDTLRNVDISCRQGEDGLFLFAIRGIKQLATAMVRSTARGEGTSRVAHLLNRLFHDGMVQHVTSDAFFVNANHDKNRVYESENSTIVIFHHDVNQIANYAPIRALPSQRGFYGRNKIYSDANKVGFFVIGSRTKYSSRALMNDYFGGKNNRIEKILTEMKSLVIARVRNDVRAQVRKNITSKVGKVLVTCRV